MQKLTKKMIINTFRRTEEEAKIMMEYQRIFPELLEDVDGFVINSKILWEKLKVKTKYADWKGLKIKNKFEENKDFIMVSKKIETIRKSDNAKIVVSEEVAMLTLDTAKEVAMLTNNDTGRLVRKNFILCDKILRSYESWLNVRDKTKESYKSMCSTIENTNNKNNKKTSVFEYSNNADMINLALLGYKSNKVKEKIKLAETNSIRDNLIAEINEAIYVLTKMNEMLIDNNIDFKTRKKMIISNIKLNYSTLKQKFDNMFI